MLESLKQFIQANNLFLPSDKLLLTVSGGIDSMVMLHLIKQLDISFAVAHCNFQLRGEESDNDACFVKTSVEILGVPYFQANFETEVYAEENHLSIQMAARELRYTWFENIRKTHGYTYVATAHNADDSIETFFINLSRGCGPDGLTGIKPKSANLVRPLLFASRNQIVQYSRRKGVNFREDSSNSSDKYLRNYIRHNVLPVLDLASDNFRKGVHVTMQNLVASQTLFAHLMQKAKKEVVYEKDGAVCLDIEKLRQLPGQTAFLWDVLNGYGFNRGTCLEISSQLDAQPGKVFLAPAYRLIKDRECLILTKIQKPENTIFYLEPGNIPQGTPFDIALSMEDFSPETPINRNPQVAMLDFGKLEWPLVLRQWRQGDYFAPLGMENLKKVSDFLIDQKLSLYEKENTWVLESGNRICWIIGRRIDNRFKIKEDTRKIARIEINAI